MRERRHISLIALTAHALKEDRIGWPQLSESGEIDMEEKAAYLRPTVEPLF